MAAAASLAWISSSLLVLLLILLAYAADPDPLQDFCIADVDASPRPNGFLCKDPKAASGRDFASDELRNAMPVDAQDALNVKLVAAKTFPALNTLGLAIVRVDMGPGGVVPMHTHPRSSELIYLEQGTVQAGFVDTNDMLFAQTLQKGDLLVVPRGLVHFQWNVGDGPATLIAVFNSQDPGVQILATSLFGSGIPDAVLRASFRVNQTIVDALRGAF